MKCLRVPKALWGRVPKEFYEQSYYGPIKVTNEVVLTDKESIAFYLKTLGYIEQQYFCAKCCLPFNSNEELSQHEKSAHEVSADLSSLIKKKATRK